MLPLSDNQRTAGLAAAPHLSAPAKVETPPQQRTSASPAGAPSTAELLARTSVIIPTLNEEGNIARLAADLPAGLHEVIFVDGLSSDGTIDAIQTLCPNARVVHQTERGKGAALRAGFAAATGDIIAMVDADGSTQLCELGAFVDVLGAGADVAKGSRYLTGGGSDDLTPIRSLGNRSITGMVNALWGTSYTDTCYGYMAFWRRHLDVLMPECDGFEVETYLSLKATMHGLAVAEVESWERTRWSGESNLHAGRDGVRIARTILKEWVGTQRARRSHAARDNRR